MTTYIKIEIKLKEETVKRLDEIVDYGKFRNKYTPEFNFPETHEDVVKAALYEYLNKVDLIFSNVIDSKKKNLNTVAPLKNNIRYYLKDVKGLKQKDLAEITNIDQGALSNILSNRNQPSMDYFLRIWIALGCPPIEHLFYRGSD